MGQKLGYIKIKKKTTESEILVRNPMERFELHVPRTHKNESSNVSVRYGFLPSPDFAGKKVALDLIHDTEGCEEGGGDTVDPALDRRSPRINQNTPAICLRYTHVSVPEECVM